MSTGARRICWCRSQAEIRLAEPSSRENALANEKCIMLKARDYKEVRERLKNADGINDARWSAYSRDQKKRHPYNYDQNL